MDTSSQPLLRLAAPIALDLVRLVLWLVLLMAVFIPLERWRGLHPQKVFRKAFGTDLVYYFLSSMAPKLLLIVPLSLTAKLVHHVMPGALYAWTGSLPVVVRLLVALVIGEIGAYWGHRLSHEIPLLWRFHAVHHSAEEMDWLVNVRAHPVDLLFTRLCGLVPLYILGFAQPTGNSFDLVPVLVTIVGTFWGFFIHANLRWRLGPLEWLLSSPAFHHWHHTNDGPELLNKNYAAMLPVVDRWFGTYYLPKQDWPGKYGVDGTVGANVTEQLLHPFTSES